MEIGIDSFAAQFDPATGSSNQGALAQLLERMELADRVGLDVFGIGEHHRKEFLDSAPTMILAAAAARTKRIRLTSAVTVLSAADPVRIFQQFATLDLLSQGRAEIVAGRGSFVDAYPLFGLDLRQYEELFEEKLALLLALRDHERVTWSGRFRPPLQDQPVYPRPVQASLPIWRGVGGTPESFAKAGHMGLPLMVAIIGGETHRFAPLVELYRRAGAQAGHPPEKLRVGMHAFGYVADTMEQAMDEMWEGYAVAMSGPIAKERGMRAPRRADFDAQAGPLGAFLVGTPDVVAEKLERHSEALGGLVRVTFQMDTASQRHDRLCKSIELIGEHVIPALAKSA